MNRMASMLLGGLLLSVAVGRVVGADEKTPVLQGETATALSLDAQLQLLKQAAGLTPLSGPGVMIRLQDRKVVGRNNGAFLPGVVHDFDLQQVANELRAAGAEAVAINGRRLTERTAIRCVGPKIFVGGVSVLHPYKVEAIGDATAMQKALTLPGGLLDNFGRSGPDARLSLAKELHLAAAVNVPTFRFGKTQ